MNESTTDDIKGRVKEAAGALTDNDELEREGEADQRAAQAKGKVEEVADKAKDVVDDVKNRVTGN